MARKPFPPGALEEKYIEHFQEAINGQSPLACALIATSFIENALMTLLAGFFLDCGSAESLFKPGNSLGDLSKCAEMAYCLGFINAAMLNNIKMIAGIRNMFAHSVEIMDFHHPSLQGSLAAMTFPKVGGDGMRPEEIVADNPWDKFSFITTELLVWIQFALMKVERRKPCELDQVW